MSTILSIDQALDGKAAFVVFSGGDILYTHLETYAGIEHQQDRLRCYRFGQVVQTIFKKFPGIEMVITELVRTYNYGRIYANPIKNLSMIQGVLNVVVNKDIPIYLVDVGNWQQAVLTIARRKKGEPKIDRKKLSVAHVKEKYDVLYSHHICDAINMIEYVELRNFELKTGVLETA